MKNFRILCGLLVAIAPVYVCMAQNLPAAPSLKLQGRKVGRRVIKCVYTSITSDMIRIGQTEDKNFGIGKLGNFEIAISRHPVRKFIW